MSLAGPGAVDTELSVFADQQGIKGKGALCLVLVVTDHAAQLGLPLDPNQLKTGKEGQVLGLGKGKVQQILARHGIIRVLAEEGGRTSRGSLGMMGSYVHFLNGLHERGMADLPAVEEFWVKRIRAFFAAKPFVLRLDPSLSMRTVVRQIFHQAETRQKEMSGAMIVGAVMQHLVGARLEMVFGQAVQHHSSSTKDEGQGRGGDFDIGDLAVHVSTAPSEALLRKCRANLEAGKRPIIATTGRGIGLALGLAENISLADRIDVVDVEQWLATGILDWSGGDYAGRCRALSELLTRYNLIVESVETDPSLRIELAASGSSKG